MSKIKGKDVLNFRGMDSISLFGNVTIEAGREVHLGVKQ